MLRSKKFQNTPDGIDEMTSYIISSLGDGSTYTSKDDDNISAIFLAGAPGAGKTEFLETILCDLLENFVVIDIDSYRSMFRGYDGENSSEYQSSSVRVADKILKYCFQNKLNFIFDGTFRNYNKVEQNLQQCEKHKRKTLIALIFQAPKISFYYTFLRKLNKKRNVPIDVFVDGFYDSIANIFRALSDFQDVNILIAEKKYNLLDKDKFNYNIDYKIANINEFCKKYRIAYNKGIFTNREKLRIDIENFNNILVSKLSGKGGIFGNMRIWLIEKFSKI